MQLNPYLIFNGDCADAFRFYERCLGGRIVGMQTHGESPVSDQVPAEWRDRILHARLEVNGHVLMGSDAPPAQYAPPQGMAVTINVSARNEAERIFGQLADGGRVGMPFQKTFWSEGFGMVADRYGTQWMVNTL